MPNKTRYDVLLAARHELTPTKATTNNLGATSSTYDISSAGGIQKILSALGCYPDDGPFDGDLRSELSIRAVKWFQSDTDLTVDGIVGKKETQPALGKYVAILEFMPPSFIAMRRWRLTSYHIADQARWHGKQPRSVEVYDNNKRPLARIEPAFFAEMSLEGTGKLEDGRVLNVTGKTVPVDSKMYEPVLQDAVSNNFIPGRAGHAGIRVRELTAGKYQVIQALAFHEVSELGAEGYGVGQGKLSYQYYKTLAADIGRYSTSEPKYRGKGGLVPVGTRVCIAEIFGDLMAAGPSKDKVHDGWFTVNDTGGAIFGAHFDIFAGHPGINHKMRHPEIGHIWFEGIERKIPYTYSYGHVQRK